MGKTKTKGPLPSGNFLFFLGVAFLLLPSAFGLVCKSKSYGTPIDQECQTDQEYCVKRWFRDSKDGAVDGCHTAKQFMNKDYYGFDPSEGCGPVPVKSAWGAFACACKTNLCNDEAFGEDKFKIWKDGNWPTTTTKAPPSSGPGLSPLLSVTLAALTVGGFLGR